MQFWLYRKLSCYVRFLRSLREGGSVQVPFSHYHHPTRQRRSLSAADRGMRGGIYFAASPRKVTISYLFPGKGKHYPTKEKAKDIEFVLKINTTAINPNPCRQDRVHHGHWPGKSAATDIEGRKHAV